MTKSFGRSDDRMGSVRGSGSYVSLHGITVTIIDMARAANVDVYRSSTAVFASGFVKTF